jgi:ABC-type amino acid transport substrate-binding protein
LAFATNAAIQLNGWESLRGATYRVEYLIGAVVERNLQQVVKPGLLSAVATAEQALKKLRAGRTDIFVHVESLVLPLLQTPEFKDAGIAPVGVMEKQDAYPFLHNKHAALAPKLAEVMQQMKAEGLFAQYQKQAAEFFQPK